MKYPNTEMLQKEISKRRTEEVMQWNGADFLRGENCPI